MSQRICASPLIIYFSSERVFQSIPSVSKNARQMLNLRFQIHDHYIVIARRTRDQLQKFANAKISSIDSNTIMSSPWLAFHWLP
jgi:hypothetical protein